MNKVNLKAKLASFEEVWVPKIVGGLNGQYVKVAKTEGEYTWHHHEHEDELFLVLEGELDIELEDQTIHLTPGEMFIVPRGVEHRPISKGVAHVLLFEPTATRNTGQTTTERTIEAVDLERL